jgi:putative MATE family efflux protein
MRDLTKGPVAGHVLHLSSFIALMTFFQSLYFIADLYFVGRLGKEAVAGVSLAGNLMMLVLALTQSLGVGATSLLAQAMGRGNRDEAERVFNQAFAMSVIVGLAFGITMFALRRPYSEWLAADALTARQSIEYLNWFIPALSLQFGMVAIGSALRGMGDMKVPTLIQISTVLLNIALAPVLMFGYGTGRPLGVAGAAVASVIAVGAANVAFVLYFARASSPLRFRRDLWKPQLAHWWSMLRIGLPVGGEFLLMTVYIVFVYAIIRPFGAAAQAGFGIGARVMQALFLPSVAIGFATAPVVGQNFGARLGDRVRHSFYAAAAMSSTVMLVLTVVCQILPHEIVRFFSSDPAVIAVGAEYLQIVGWAFVVNGVIFVSSSTFQGIGHTLPALASSALRLGIFMVPCYMLSRQPGFQMRHIWYLAVGTVLVQVSVSLWLLHREFTRKLIFDPHTTAPVRSPIA